MQTRILLLLLFVALAYSSTFYYYVSPSGVDNSLCNAAKYTSLHTLPYPPFNDHSDIIHLALRPSSTLYFYLLSLSPSPCQTIAHCLTLGPSGSDISVTLNSTAGSYGSENCGVIWSTDSIFFICFVLFCFVLFCFVLFCFVLFCFVLFCFVLFCFVLFCFVFIYSFIYHLYLLCFIIYLFLYYYFILCFLIR